MIPMTLDQAAGRRSKVTKNIKNIGWDRHCQIGSKRTDLENTFISKPLWPHPSPPPEMGAKRGGGCPTNFPNFLKKSDPSFPSRFHPIPASFFHFSIDGWKMDSSSPLVLPADGVVLYDWAAREVDGRLVWPKNPTADARPVHDLGSLISVDRNAVNIIG